MIYMVIIHEFKANPEIIKRDTGEVIICLNQNTWKVASKHALSYLKSFFNYSFSEKYLEGLKTSTNVFYETVVPKPWTTERFQSVVY